MRTLCWVLALLAARAGGVPSSMVLTANDLHRFYADMGEPKDAAHCELVLQEYEQATVVKAIRRVEQHSWLKLDKLRALAQSPRSVWQETAKMFDRYWKRERNLDYRLRRYEGTANRR